MMNKRLLIPILLVSTVFLVVLGMRIPSLDHNHGPKQRPRAILEEVSKSSSTKVCKVPCDLSIPHQVVLKKPVVEPPSFIPLTICQPTSPTAGPRQSRSPPSYLSVISA